MRILHCIETIGSGGVDRLRLSIIRSLKSPEYEHRVICASARGALADAIRAEGVEILEVGTVASVFSTKRYQVAARIVDQWAPDIIHGAVIDGYTLAAIVGRWKKVGAVIIEETSDPANRSWKGHVLASIMGRLSHRAVAVSPSVESYLKRIKIPGHKIVLINNGVTKPKTVSEDIRKATRRGYGIASGALVVGSVGRMHDETDKRFGDLIRAFARVSVGQPIQLLLVGDGRERAGLERLAHKLGVGDRLVFAGYQFEMDRFYAIMDIFALASEREAFGLVNAEAMRHGLPVVATAVGGIPFIVRDGETGILVPPRDISRMAEALGKLLTNEEQRKRLGDKGREVADAEYSEERYIRDITELYRSLAPAG